MTTPGPTVRIRWQRVFAVVLVVIALLAWRSGSAWVQSGLRRVAGLFSGDLVPEDRLVGLVTLGVIVIALLSALRLLLEHERNRP